MKFGVSSQQTKSALALAYVIGQHQDSVLLKLKALLEPFGVRHFFTDGWGGYERHISAEQLSIGKENTQKIERKHLIPDPTD